VFGRLFRTRTLTNGTPRARLAGLFVAGLLESDAPHDALYQLDGFWSSRLRDGATLSPVEKDVHDYLVYMGEVGNGGHAQYFMNPSGDHVEETLAALLRLELAEHHSILVEALSLLPGGQVAGISSQREAAVSALSDTALGRLAELDRALAELSQSSFAQVLRYVRNHQDQVLVEERA